ncbi:MAG TPA: S8 family peptidase [Acidimicrobiia bacterium]|jgi:serine protease AprX|nr:S8 family peptidase [Acidimicrobiia bacterium]
MRAKRKLIASVLFVLLGAWIAPAVANPSLASDAVADSAVIVQGTSQAAVRAAVEAHHGTVTQDLWIVQGVAANIPAGELAALQTEPGVTHVTEDAPVHIQAAQPSPLHAATAVYPKVVGADRLWTEGIDGEGVTVAVVDTGITPVADLAGRVIGGVDFSGGDDPYNDEFGHGTFVAGIIAGNGASSNGAYKGVAPKAKLVSIKIAGRNGASDITHVLAAIQWAVSFRNDYGIRVLNLSLGTDSTQPYMLSPLDSAVERAWDAGIVVTVSSSNKGPGPGTVTKPADDPLVITVGALDDRGTPGRGDDVMAGFSGEGPTAADGLNKPDLVASGRSIIGLRVPGSKVDSAYPGSRVGSAYFKGSGTSFSNAVTSGSAALLLEREPSLTPDQVKDRLLGSAAPGPVGNANVDGRGSLDTYAAAHAGTFAAANQGVVRSLGSGSLQLDRGSLQINIQVGGLLDPIFQLLTPVLKLLVGNLTAQNQTFDQLAYFSSEWTGSSWYGSSWYGSSWYGSSWYGSSWYGSSWYGSSWYGSSWYATAWE